MADSKSKKFYNSVEGCVDDCLEGLCAVNPGLRVLEGHRVVVRHDITSLVKRGQVTIVSGGGSGHEPAHAGYIGEGMLSAAVAGAVFTSPPPADILAAIRTIGTNNKGGVLVVVKNYTGDRLNFGLAVERARAEGIKADMIVVGEDCALTSADKTAGRRGLCGTIFIHKIAGFLAQADHPLEKILTVVKQATKQMGTIGLSLTPCSLPGATPSFQLAADEMELGLGIHGEAGVKRMKLQSAKDAVRTAISHMTNPQTSTHLELAKGESVAVMVNNLGGTSVLELNIIVKEAITYLEERGLLVERAYCGSFMTSMEMAGVSLTVLKLNDTLKQCLDGPTSAPGWQVPLLSTGATDRQTPPTMMPPSPAAGSAQAGGQDNSACTLSQSGSETMTVVLRGIAESLLSSEDRLNGLDKQSGDGDCGSTMARGARGLLEALDKGLPVSCPSACALALSAVAENVMGGSSGALYSLFLTAAAGPLVSGCGPTEWGKAWQAGNAAIMRYGGAEPGQRTMLDPLDAAASTFSQKLQAASALHAFTAALAAAESAAEATTKMAAQAGRASYVSADLLTQPDPGAVAVAVWMKAVLNALQ